MPSSITFLLLQSAGMFLALAVLLWLIARRLRRAATLPATLARLPAWLTGAALLALAAEWALKFNLESTWLRAGLLAGLAALVVWFARLSYAPQVNELQPAHRKTLIALRLAGLMLLLALIFQPGLRLEFQGRNKPTLPVILDTSVSMSFVDTPGQPHRLRRVQNTLFGRDGVYERLTQYYEVELFAADSGARPVVAIGAADALKPDGLATALAPAIQSANARARETATAAGPPVAALLFSDGLDNTGRPFIEEIRALGLQVHAVGVGTSVQHDNALQDISITDVAAPRTASRGELTRIKVLVDAVGLAGQPVQVTIEQHGQPIKSADLTLDGRRGDQEVALEFIPDTEGRQEYTARVSQLPQERIRENNAAEFSLNVREPLIKVLLFDSPRYESRWLARFIERETRFQPKILFKTHSGFFMQRGEVGGLNLTGFPATAAELSLFDVFIIGDLHASHIPGEVQERLAGRVKAGAGIIFLAGDAAFGRGGWEKTPLADLFPVTMNGAEDELAQRKFFPALAPAGRGQPILAGLDGVWAQGKDTATQKDLAPMELINAVRGLAPGAQLLLSTPVNATDPAQTAAQPVLAVKLIGQGRCAALLAQPTWPWFTLEGAAGKHATYPRLWGQMIRWLAGQDAKERGSGAELTVFTDRATYRPATPVTVFAFAGGDNGQRLDTAQIEATVTGPDGYSAKLTLASVPEDFGRYEVAFTPPTPGNYSIHASGSDNGKAIGEADVKITVGRPNLEYERFGMDEQKLRDLASATGGSYANLGEIDRMLEHLQADSTARVVVWEIPFYNNWLFFVLIVGCFSAEWYLRKAHRLP